MRDPRDVAVFWDIDACPVPPQISGFEVVDKIRLFTQTLGIVKSLKGYTNLLDLQTSRVFQLRSELQSSGVSLIDCPATERRSNASKMMIVDLLTHAVDNSPSTTLCIIAGNTDFSYAVSILRLRKYRVVLICPKARVGPHSQASLYFDWFHDVLGNECHIDDAPDIPRLQRPRRYTNSTSAGTDRSSRNGTALNRDTASHEHQMSLPNDSPQPASTNSLHEDSHTEHLHPLPREYSEEQRTPTQSAPRPERGTADVLHNGELSQLTNSSIIMGFDDHIQRPSSAPPSYLSFSPAPSPLSHDFYPPTVPSRFIPTGPDFMNTLYNGRTSEDLFHEGGPPSQPERPAPLPVPGSPANTSTDTVMPSPASTLGTLRANVTSPAIVAPTTLSQTTAPGIREHPAPPTIPEFTSGLASPVLTPRPSPLVVPTTLPPSPATPISGREQTELPSSSSNLLQVPEMLAGPMTASLLEPPPVRPLAPNVIPSHFQALVDNLREYRDKGDHKPFRPSIAALMISSNTGDIQAAGATSFTHYAQLAEKAGIVELPKKAGEFWIALRPGI